MGLGVIPALFAFAAALLAPGEHLPEVKGETLNGRTVELPAIAHGRVSLVAFGFSHASRHDVEAWVKRFRTEFGSDSRTTFFEVPMIGGMGRMGKPFIQGGMRRGTPKADWDLVITVFGGTGPWKERLGVKASDVAYPVLLDAEGNVRWLGKGPLNDKEFQSLAETARKLLPASGAASSR